MRKAEGNLNALPLECLNPKKGLWRVRLGITPTDTGAEWQEEDFDHQPTADEVRALWVQIVDDRVSRNIREGMPYEGAMVWLSIENQLNYRAALDLALQTNGSNLPLHFKLGTDEQPVYKDFATVEALTDFYTAVATHIQRSLEEGWKEKEAFDVEPYLRE